MTENGSIRIEVVHSGAVDRNQKDNIFQRNFECPQPENIHDEKSVRFSQDLFSHCPHHK